MTKGGHAAAALTGTFVVIPFVAALCACGSVPRTPSSTASHSAQVSPSAKTAPSAQATPSLPPTPDPVVQQLHAAASAFDQVDKEFESKITPGYDTLNIDLGANKSDAVITTDCRNMVSILGALVTAINKIDFPSYIRPEANGIVTEAQQLSGIFSDMVTDSAQGKVASFNKAWDSTEAVQRDLDTAIRALRTDLQLPNQP